MANKILALTHTEAGVSLYALIWQDDGKVFDSTTDLVFETYATASLNDYDIVGTELGTASRRYTFAVPSQVPAGRYRVTIHKRVGANPAEGDPLVGEGDLDWNGLQIIGPYDGWAQQAPRVSEVRVTSFAADTTSHAVNMPLSSPRKGDLIIVQFVNDGSATVTTPAGWTLLRHTDGTAVQMSSFARIADGTEFGTTVDFATSAAERAVAKVFLIRRGNWFGEDVDITTGDSIVAMADNTGNDTIPEQVSVSMRWRNIPVLVIALEGHDDGTVATTAFPADYVDGGSSASDANAAGVVASSATKVFCQSASIPLADFTIASAQEWCTDFLVIRCADPSGYVGASNISQVTRAEPLTTIRDAVHDGSVLQGTASATGSTTTNIKIKTLSITLTVTNQLKGRVVLFKRDTVTANLRGQGAPISGNSTTDITIASGDALTTAPAEDEAFSIM